MISKNVEERILNKTKEIFTEMEEIELGIINWIRYYKQRKIKIPIYQSNIWLRKFCSMLLE